MRALGGILLAVGILIAGLSGLCSLVFFLTELTSPYSRIDETLGMVAFVGGIPFAIGLGLLFLGRKLMRSAQAD